MQHRYDAIKKAMSTIKDLAAHQEGQPLLHAISPVLISLGEQEHLFPKDEFGSRAGKTGGLYQLWRGLDGDLALYASAGKTGKKQPPHDHTTWAVIAGVYGEEHNVFFERVDNRSVEGQGKLRQTDELTVCRGNAALLLGDTFHTIEVVSDEDSLHLHLYGRALDTLSGRINFTAEEGGAYSRFMAVPETYAPWIAPQAVYDMLTDGREFAILDVRENGVYTQGHIFHAASMPLSHLELRIQALPSLHTRLVLVDDDDGLAESASRRLHALGYHNVAVLKGGQKAWDAAGLPTYSGVFVPSKAFGEVVEHHYKTPHITASELDALVKKQDILILDSRTEEEFKLMSIPGALSCPGGELVARALNHTGPIVVNCAGRTRSILGAQSLINAGFADVHALENGTMGQYLAGLSLDKSQTRSYLTQPIAAGAEQAAQELAKSLSIETISPQRLQDLLSDGTRVTYLFDVRDPKEFSAATLLNAVSAPGGQLVQQTDEFAPIRNARIVVFDTAGVQAPMTASWLHQMGWDTYIYQASTGDLVKPVVRQHAVDVPTSDVATLSADAAIVDVGDSRVYRKGHLPGAKWVVRSRLATVLKSLAPGQEIVFTCPTGAVSRLAAMDALLLGFKASYLHGGTRSVPVDKLTSSDAVFMTETDDVWYRPYDRDTGIVESMHQYLSWEIGLLDRVRADPTVTFRI